MHLGILTVLSAESVPGSAGRLRLNSSRRRGVGGVGSQMQISLIAVWGAGQADRWRGWWWENQRPVPDLPTIETACFT